MERLRAWMTAHDMKQVDLARRMDISEAAVSLIISGKREITSGFIGDFFLAFGSEATEEVFGTAEQPAEAQAEAIA